MHEDYLYFGGTAYLGLPTNLSLKTFSFKTVLRWGSSCNSSEMQILNWLAYENSEHFLAKFIKAEATLTVSHLEDVGRKEK
jgi:7-keto-8-aminopelargonate synthetase-like enzyme